MRLVTPPSVTLTGEGIDSAGAGAADAGAHLPRHRRPAFEVKIAGTGSLRNRRRSQRTPRKTTGSRRSKQAPARVYSQLPWVLGLTLGILALGGVMLYRKGAA